MRDRRRALRKGNPRARSGHQGRRGDSSYTNHYLTHLGFDPRAEAESAERVFEWRYLDSLREDRERYAAEEAAAKAELAAELASYAAEAAAEKAAAAAKEEEREAEDSDDDSDGDDSDGSSDGDDSGDGSGSASGVGEAEAEPEPEEEDGDAAASASPNVAAITLDTVLEYCNKHADPGDAAATKPDSDPTASTVAGSSSSSSVNAAASEDLEVWDRELVDLMPLNALHDLLLAANYLEIEGPLDDICQKVADMIKGKTTDEIRDTFNIENDFTAEEEELRKEFTWAFDE